VLQLYCILYIRQDEDDNGEKMSKETAYEILELNPGASAKEVKDKYRELSLEYHPDRHENSSARQKRLNEQQFRQISDAFELLSTEGNCRYSTDDWLSLHENGKALITPKAKQVVHCFTCETKARLPASKHWDTTRCPDCQTLLVMPTIIAQNLTAAD